MGERLRMAAILSFQPLGVCEEQIKLILGFRKASSRADERFFGWIWVVGWTVHECLSAEALQR